MPLLASFSAPSSPAALRLPSDRPVFFLAFVASADPATGASWCPDVRAALPVLETAFTPADAPELALVEVGQRPEWRKPSNVYRANWNVNNVPTLVRFEQGADGAVKETGRLVEGEILDSARLSGFIAGRP